MSFQIHITERLADFYIDVSNSSDGTSAQQCAYDTVPYRTAETRIYTCPSNIYGQFVRIRLGSDNHLQLCEVQIQGGMFTGFEKILLHFDYEHIIIMPTSFMWGKKR